MRVGVGSRPRLRGYLVCRVVTVGLVACTEQAVVRAVGEGVAVLCLGACLERHSEECLRPKGEGDGEGEQA